MTESDPKELIIPTYKPKRTKFKLNRNRVVSYCSVNNQILNM